MNIPLSSELIVYKPIFMECREGCAACCIYLSISSPIPGMTNGKPAGVRCIHLSENLKCNIFTSPDRPKVCDGFKPEKLFCGETSQEAYVILAGLEDIEVVDNYLIKPS